MSRTDTSRGAHADRLIVALDVTTLAAAMRLARALRGVVRTVKIGSTLFTAYGPAVIQRVRSLGFHVMLDLKFFDIPSTVELSCQVATRHLVSMLTVHALGQRKMLEAAVRGARREAERRRTDRPLVLAVTVLTSVERLPAARVTETVLALASKARSAGCDGVVASAQEAPILRRHFGHRLQIVCPGIRPVSGREGDQRRVCTPSEALACGADWLVVGRPIIAARHPRLAAQHLLKEMEVVDAC